MARNVSPKPKGFAKRRGIVLESKRLPGSVNREFWSPIPEKRILVVNIGGKGNRRPDVFEFYVTQKKVPLTKSDKLQRPLRLEEDWKRQWL